ncbi:RnaseH-domain-containing protein [Lenzites betulinus]|nr:RnaseH-domain-containing protein [Lenzites betulinus]
MTIITDSTYAYLGLTEHLQKWEDRGWQGVDNKEILQLTAAKLRRRSAPTWIKWVKGHSGVPGNEAADVLANSGTSKRAIGIHWREEEKAFLAKGARLSALSQKLAYRSIQEWAAPKGRTSTQRNLDMIKAALREDFGTSPTTGAIWTAVWGTDISRKASSFFWKAIHGAYKIGEYWSNIPGYEQRAMCMECNVPESMDHILLECGAPGRRQLWEEADAILRRGGIRPPKKSLGMAVGATALKADAIVDKASAAKSRLLKIVVTEVVYLIWKVRCERVIGWAGESGRTHPSESLARAWSDAINMRLHTDIARSRTRSKRGRLSREVVLDTWRGTLLDEGALPEDWIDDEGVLVGTLRTIREPP